ncbi:MAG TPA: aminotransferase class V-fold PLP-dependent enzyme [Tahibacter sp.]|uniref:aminotransferase class V-fold PLP-dependent enzyme n=1 Tax=Tahibacter sp. TaxID=2056211 RepID=UPI002CA76C37|nr:aminotransferase class V-fold PLP-dependent enzyme [Tahibacter sp.]HSX62254.1 aminotransferase class V-fold PLP-dependent enzyme [Tahibacter sp.]
MTDDSRRVAPRSRARDDDYDFAALRRREFARLDAQRHAYLDYTGSALYGTSQLRAHAALLDDGIYGNPHSESATARASTAAIERAREDVLQFFGVDASTHAVCFTANCSAAIKLVAESYRFDAQRGLLLSADNHNSVNGVREYARRAGAAVRVLPLNADLELDDPHARIAAAAAGGAGLFAYPAQSNFSGVRHPLSLVRHAREQGFQVLLDAAAFVPGHALDLRDCPADFTVLSFYKLFGYPTGLGALVVRRDALAQLHRPWFAGGTVRFASVAADRHRLLAGAEGFEDGTPDFLGIAALPAGFSLLREVGLRRVDVHNAALVAAMLDGLSALRHADGAPRVRLYGRPHRAARGCAVTFNVLDRHGGALPYAAIEAAARDAGISVRGGCFCNPGASEAAFRSEPARLAQCLDELGDDFTPQRLSACSGHETGAIRASVGMASSFADVERLIALIAQCGLDDRSAAGVVRRC